MAHPVLRSLGRMTCSANQGGSNGLIRQALQRNISPSMKGIVAEISLTTKSSKSPLRNMLVSAGVKSKQKFNISEMQRCLASVDLISNVSVTTGSSSASDSDLLEGADEGDDVCSQGKKHGRRAVCA